jgi:hypothetical protein
MAALIDDLHGVGRQPRHRAGHQIDDGRNLIFRKLAAIGQAQHDAGRRGDLIAHEDRFLALGQMDAHRLNPVDLLDREHQFMFAGRAQTLAFQSARGAHRQLVEAVIGGVGQGERAVLGHQHARLVDVALIHRQRAGAAVDAVMDVALVQRADHAGAFGIVKLGIEHALRRGGQRGPGHGGTAQHGHAGEPGQSLFHRPLCQETARAFHRRAARRIGECTDQRLRLRWNQRHTGIGRNGLSHGLDPQLHDVLIGGQ